MEETECHFLPGDTGRRGYNGKMTNGDIGGRGVLKFCIFAVTSFLNGSLLNQSANSFLMHYICSIWVEINSLKFSFGRQKSIRTV